MRVTGCIEKYASGGYFWYVFDGDEIKYRHSERRPSPIETVAGGFGCTFTRWGARVALRRAIKGHLNDAGVETYKGEIKEGEVNVQRG